jgi:hypothetical protein
MNLHNYLYAKNSCADPSEVSSDDNCLKAEHAR